MSKESDKITNNAYVEITYDRDGKQETPKSFYTKPKQRELDIERDESRKKDAKNHGMERS